MLPPDRLGARVNNWLLLLYGGLTLAAYYLVPVPFLSLAAAMPAAEKLWTYLGIFTGALVGLCLPLLVISQRLGIPFDLQFLLAWPRPLPLLGVAAATLSLVPTLEILTQGAGRLFPPSQDVLVFLERLRPRGPVEYAAAGLALAAAVPLGEELLFRGLFLRILLRQSRPVTAIVLCGFLFGALHPLYSIPGVALLGIYFGALTVLMGNLAYAIAAHAIWNLANLAFLSEGPVDVQGVTQTPFSDHALLWLALSLTLFAVFNGFALRTRQAA
jgi:membrane protease YdiL (CAAX protease family)